MSVFTSDGCVGRCDAKCHDAEGTHCDCICGGANHGAGLAQAMANTREKFHEWIERWKQEHPGDHRFDVDPEVLQGDLFDAFTSGGNQ